METIKCLDHGYVQLIDTFGDELTIVNAARVSFGAEKRTLSEGDIKLMRYLYREKHMSPFRHLMFRFKIKAPEFVMRQLYKHVVGIEATSDTSFQLHGWNELSGRYKPINGFYTDFAWRKQSLDNKQASDGELPAADQDAWKKALDSHMEATVDMYQNMLKAGIAKEQARMILPLNMYTEVIWTASAQAVLNFIELRDHHHAQVEIQAYAKAMRDFITEKFPVLSRIWFEKEPVTPATPRLLVVDTSSMELETGLRVQMEFRKLINVEHLFSQVTSITPNITWYTIDERRSDSEVVDMVCDTSNTDVDLELIRGGLVQNVLTMFTVFDRTSSPSSLVERLRVRLQ